ncbi:MAG: hypothetical protein BWY25_02900 [Chloroflexi bacterium ADurb.Bin222]|nr:MAG: hypothetical protein BWY25_02900 [Chloroflexi bacterium ADurb.Bin222]
MMDGREWRSWQRMFLLLFGVLGLILGALLLHLSAPRYTGMATRPGEPSQPVPPLPLAERIALIVSVASTLLTALGFISTTALAWRKERRESRSAALEEQREQLELEKLRRELQPKSEGGQGTAAAPR